MFLRMCSVEIAQNEVQEIVLLGNPKDNMVYKYASNVCS